MAADFWTYKIYGGLYFSGELGYGRKEMDIK